MKFLERLFGQKRTPKQASSASAALEDAPPTAEQPGSFPGFRKFTPGQKEPQEFTSVIALAIARFERQETKSTFCFFGFDSEKDRSSVCSNLVAVFTARASVKKLENIPERNYVLQVEYAEVANYDAIIKDAVRLRSEFNATDISMVPIPKPYVEKLWAVYGDKCCPFFSVLTSSLNPIGNKIEELVKTVGDTDQTKEQRLAAVQTLASMGETGYDALSHFALDFSLDPAIKAAVDREATKLALDGMKRKMGL